MQKLDEESLARLRWDSISQITQKHLKIRYNNESRIYVQQAEYKAKSNVLDIYWTVVSTFQDGEAIPVQNGPKSKAFHYTVIIRFLNKTDGNNSTVSKHHATKNPVNLAQLANWAALNPQQKTTLIQRILEVNDVQVYSDDPSFYWQGAFEDLSNLGMSIYKFTGTPGKGIWRNKHANKAGRRLKNPQKRITKHIAQISENYKTYIPQIVKALDRNGSIKLNETTVDEWLKQHNISLNDDIEKVYALNKKLPDKNRDILKQIIARALSNRILMSKHIERPDVDSKGFQNLDDEGQPKITKGDEVYYNEKPGYSKKINPIIVEKVMESLSSISDKDIPQIIKAIEKLQSDNILGKNISAAISGNFTTTLKLVFGTEAATNKILNFHVENTQYTKGVLPLLLLGNYKDSPLTVNLAKQYDLDVLINGSRQKVEVKYSGGRLSGMGFKPAILTNNDYREAFEKANKQFLSSIEIKNLIDAIIEHPELKSNSTRNPVGETPTEENVGVIENDNITNRIQTLKRYPKLDKLEHANTDSSVKKNIGNNEYEDYQKDEKIFTRITGGSYFDFGIKSIQHTYPIVLNYYKEHDLTQDQFITMFKEFFESLYKKQYYKSHYKADILKQTQIQELIKELNNYYNSNDIINTSKKIIAINANINFIYYALLNSLNLDDDENKQFDLLCIIGLKPSTNEFGFLFLRSPITDNGQEDFKNAINSDKIRLSKQSNADRSSSVGVTLTHKN
jgi:hypothetical protein